MVSSTKNYHHCQTQHQLSQWHLRMQDTGLNSPINQCKEEKQNDFQIKSSVDCFTYFLKLQDAKALRTTKVSEPQSATTKVDMGVIMSACNARKPTCKRKGKPTTSQSDHVKLQKKEYEIFYSTAASPPTGWQVRYVCPFQKTNVPYLQYTRDYIGAIQKLGSPQIHNPGGWTNY